MAAWGIRCGSPSASVFLMGLTRFRLREIVEKAAGKATDLISAKQVSANDSEYRVAA